MGFFNGSIVIGAGEFKTIQELIAAALAARTYASAGSEADAMSRANQFGSGGYIIPAAVGCYIIDAYKGVVNGVATQSAWAAGDFTMAPGGGQPLPAASQTLIAFSLGNRVIYNSTGAPITIYLDI